MKCISSFLKNLDKDLSTQIKETKVLKNEQGPKVMQHGLEFTYKNGKTEQKFYESESVRDAAFRPWKKKLNSRLGRLTTDVKSVRKIRK